MTTIKRLLEPSSLTYVRESRATTDNPYGKIKLPKGFTLVAFEEHVPPVYLDDDEPPVYLRRYWWLKGYDWDIAHDLQGVYSPKNKQAPNEAVIPSSIAIGRKSQRFTGNDYGVDSQ